MSGLHNPIKVDMLRSKHVPIVNYYAMNWACILLKIYQKFNISNINPQLKSVAFKS